MIPKKIYLNYVEEEDFDNGAEITWCVDPVSVAGCEMKNREYTDLSQVWHPAEEEPEENRYILTCEGANRYNTLKWLNTWLTWRSIARIYEVKRWAYIEDLLPKGGEL